MRIINKKYSKIDVIEPVIISLGELLGIIFFWGSIVGYILLITFIFTVYFVWFILFVKDKIIVSERSIIIRSFFKRKTYDYVNYILFKVDKFNGRDYLTGVKEDFKRDFIYNLRQIENSNIEIVDYCNNQIKMDNSLLVTKYEDYLSGIVEQEKKTRIDTRNKLIFSTLVTLVLGFIPTIIIAVTDITYKSNNSFENSVKLPTIIYIVILLFAGVFIGISFATTKIFYDDTGNKSDSEFVFYKRKSRIAGIILYIIALVIIAYTYSVY